MKQINEIEYFNQCYKCKKPSELSLCKNCIKKYNKTWYYAISRNKTWPKNIISGKPVKIFGIYLFTIIKLAKDNYEWQCLKPLFCQCPNCKKEKTSLNPEHEILKDEKAIDIFTNGLGAYCGSFTVPTEEAERYVFAINSAGQLLIKGKQTNQMPIFASIRK